MGANGESRSKTSGNRSRLISTQSQSGPTLADYMGWFDPKVQLKECLALGTHDALTHKIESVHAKTQRLGVKGQLENGARSFDFRFKLKHNPFTGKTWLVAFHGPYEAEIDPEEVFGQILSFMNEHPTEFAILRFDHCEPEVLDWLMDSHWQNGIMVPNSPSFREIMKRTHFDHTRHLGDVTFGELRDQNKNFALIGPKKDYKKPSRWQRFLNWLSTHFGLFKISSRAAARKERRMALCFPQSEFAGHMEKTRNSMDPETIVRGEIEGIKKDGDELTYISPIHSLDITRPSAWFKLPGYNPLATNDKLAKEMYQATLQYAKSEHYTGFVQLDDIGSPASRELFHGIMEINAGRGCVADHPFEVKPRPNKERIAVAEPSAVTTMKHGRIPGSIIKTRTLKNNL